MKRPIYIGDELTASGYRLAGVRTRTPPPEAVTEVFAWACRESDLVLLGVAQARQIPAGELESALCALHPQVLVVPDITEREPMRDLAARIRSQLGVSG